MKQFIFVLFLAIIPSFSFAEVRNTDWTTQDTLLQSTFIVLQTIDWGQTRWIANSYHVNTWTEGDVTHYHSTWQPEINPILGERPRRENVDLFFGLGIPVHAVISYGLRKSGWKVSDISFMPSSWDTPLVTAWQSISIGFEGAVVANNWRIGIGLKF